MEGVEGKVTPGYGRPPWIFKGRALYQLHLVKADVARSYIPKEFRLVEAFGWAARVLVNSEEACSHGRKDVGLPSQVANFSKSVTVIENHRKGKVDGLLNIIGLGTNGSSLENQLTIRVAEANDSSMTDTCDVNLTTDSTLQKAGKWMGVPITMSLPSFSGRTMYNPNLLKYACQVQCRVRAVKPAVVTVPANSNMLKVATEEDSVRKEISVSSIMLSRPILALEFSCLRMEVEEPLVVSPEKHL